jgi:hypothetical protein
LSLYPSIVRSHCPPRLHFKPLKLLNLDFNVNSEPDPAFHYNADPDPNPDPASPNSADPSVSGSATLF